MPSKDWGSIQEGSGSQSGGSKSTEPFFDAVDSSTGQLQSASNSLSQMVAMQQRAQAQPAATQSNAPRIGGGSEESEGEDEN